MPESPTLLIEHISNRPDLRKMHPEERIYASLWQTWNREGLVNLPLPRPAMTQADATVAAGVIQHLGTKAGILMLTSAWDSIEAGNKSERAWLKEFRHFTADCWPHVNKGFTAFELCLVPAWSQRQRWASVSCLPRDPYLASTATKRELQVARAVFRWLATYTGHTFVAEAEALITAHKAHRAAVFHQRNLDWANEAQAS